MTKNVEFFGLNVHIYCKITVDKGFLPSGICGVTHSNGSALTQNESNTCDGLKNPCVAPDHRYFTPTRTKREHF